MDIGRLLFPALRWKEGRGFDHEKEKIAAALRLGVGGFILFGGDAEAVRELTGELRSGSPHPLLIGADLERGAGQQFRGATRLPPAAALGALDDHEVSRRAGALTAREALALGVNWVYAPVADVDLESRNPIVGSRAFGSDPRAVARHVTAWVGGCRDEGALSCAKHFPGHGRTTADSHVELPRVVASRDELEADLGPFRSAVAAGVDSVMSAHVVYESLDPRNPATLSPLILMGLLKGELGFDGLVVTDAMNMGGVLAGAETPGEAGVRALGAGADVLLYPDDAEAIAGALRDAVGAGLSEARVSDALRRIAAAAEQAPQEPTGEWGRAEDQAWALDLARRSLVAVRGEPALPRGGAALLTVDDDVGGPYPPPSREPFERALERSGIAVDARGLADPSIGSEPRTEQRKGLPEPGISANARLAGGAAAQRAQEAGVYPGQMPDRARVVVALYADIRGWKGRPGVSERARTEVEQALAADPEAVVVLFGHPRLASEIPGDRVLAAWGGEAIMQEAAAVRLSEDRPA